MMKPPPTPISDVRMPTAAPNSSSPRTDRRADEAGNAVCQGRRVACCRRAKNRPQRLDQHACANKTEQDDIEKDHDVAELAIAQQQLGEIDAEASAEPAAGQKNQGHLEVDIAVAPMQVAGTGVGTGHLRRAARDRYDRRYPVKDEQLRDQKPATHSVQSGEKTDQSAIEQDQDDIDVHMR